MSDLRDERKGLSYFRAISLATASALQTRVIITESTGLGILRALCTLCRDTQQPFEFAREHLHSVLVRRRLSQLTQEVYLNTFSILDANSLRSIDKITAERVHDTDCMPLLAPGRIEARFVVEIKPDAEMMSSAVLDEEHGAHY
jgi:hypothetical protein